MPYSVTELDKIPKYIQKLDEKKQRQWVHIWNSVYERTGDESRAYATANGVVLHGRSKSQKVVVDYTVQLQEAWNKLYECSEILKNIANNMKAYIPHWKQSKQKEDHNEFLRH